MKVVKSVMERNIRLMKFGIEKYERCISRTIDGKKVLSNVEYYIYRSYFFGLIRRYLWLSCPHGVRIAYEVRFKYVWRKSFDASSFMNETDAMEVLSVIREHPEKFVRYVKNQ